ncbi:hypothetical protein D3C72_1787190 [compost metagenome]
MAGQGHFQAATQCVALDQGDRADVAAEAGVQVVHTLHAALRVGQQQVAVAFPDQPGEQVQVAAQVVGGGVGGQHEMAQLAAVALRRAACDGAHVAPHLVQHVLAAAGTHGGGGIGVHEQPVGGAVGAVLGADGGIGRAAAGQLFDGTHGRVLGDAARR